MEAMLEAEATFKQYGDMVEWVAYHAFLEQGHIRIVEDGVTGPCIRKLERVVCAVSIDHAIDCFATYDDWAGGFFRELHGCYTHNVTKDRAIWSMENSIFVVERNW